MIASALKHWLPYKLFATQAGLQCGWLFTADKRFVEPFFDETILKCLSHPFNSKPFKVLSDLDILEPWSSEMAPVKPSAVIFHISRCGSTLLAQLLSLMQQNIVLSEVPFFDDILRLPYKENGITETKADKLFKAALSFYGQKNFEGEQYLFLKTDSWHILFYKQLRKLFPDIPFVLLYRKPDEVVLSHQRKRGVHAVPGLLQPQMFGWSREEMQHLSLDAYITKVLEVYFAAYIDVAASDKNIVLANYSEGIPVILERIFEKTGLHLSAENRENARIRASFDAKQPNRKFLEPACNSAESAMLLNCFRLYEQLDKLRF